MQCAGVRLSHLGMVGSHKVEVAGATHAVSGRLSKQLVSQGGGQGWPGETLVLLQVS